VKTVARVNKRGQSFQKGYGATLFPSALFGKKTAAAGGFRIYAAADMAESGAYVSVKTAQEGMHVKGKNFGEMKKKSLFSGCSRKKGCRFFSLRP
jgi:ADP-dependent phosphofructokinase/glucokinase